LEVKCLLVKYTELIAFTNLPANGGFVMSAKMANILGILLKLANEMQRIDLLG